MRDRTGERGQVLVTLLRVLREVEREPWTAADLAAHLGILSRTVYRTFAAFRVAGLQLEQHREGQRVHWRLARGSLRRWLNK